MAAWKQDLARPFFLCHARRTTRITHDGLSERLTTRSLWPTFPPIQILNDSSVFQFLRRSVDGKQLLGFPSEPPFSKFLQRSVENNRAKKKYLPSITSGLRFANRHFTTWPGSDKNLATRGFTSPTETHSELPKSTWNTSTSNKLFRGPFVSSTVQRKLFTRLRYHLPSSLNRAQQ